jgi:hypothetical protein
VLNNHYTEASLKIKIPAEWSAKERTHELTNHKVIQQLLSQTNQLPKMTAFWDIALK